ncbi:hypothetical protein B0T16DRAFT_228479 [Cercophora newfieldiana]|uniref:Uncharacterized protein n=1 Tax=Cercophora newfieldiana TaxID=92897 RepID=A0AA39XR38_9PEZI|nr:hypothetical protein B0T16DRAFT_228479 [Cercophora newfieldiana]
MTASEGETYSLSKHSDCPVSIYRGVFHIPIVCVLSRVPVTLGCYITGMGRQKVTELNVQETWVGGWGTGLDIYLLSVYYLLRWLFCARGLRSRLALAV